MVKISKPCVAVNYSEEKVYIFKRRVLPGSLSSYGWEYISKKGGIRTINSDGKELVVHQSVFDIHYIIRPLSVREILNDAGYRVPKVWDLLAYFRGSKDK